jgi:hypothetical protein
MIEGSLLAGKPGVVASRLPNSAWHTLPRITINESKKTRLSAALNGEVKNQPGSTGDSAKICIPTSFTIRHPNMKKARLSNPIIKSLLRDSSG